MLLFTSAEVLGTSCRGVTGLGPGDGNIDLGEHGGDIGVKLSLGVELPDQACRTNRGFGVGSGVGYKQSIAGIPSACPSFPKFEARAFSRRDWVFL